MPGTNPLLDAVPIAKHRGCIARRGHNELGGAVRLLRGAEPVLSRNSLSSIRSMLFAVYMVMLASGSQQAVAQNALQGIDPSNSTKPPAEYYQALEIYRSGDLPTANAAFENALGRTRKDINGRWIDSIPVYAMLAECQWHLGDVVAAREYLDRVFHLAITNRGWLQRVQWDGMLMAGGARARPSWLWPDAAAVNQLPITARMPFSAGAQIVSSQQLNGVLPEAPNTKIMDIVEIMRGLAIASYRRRMILGPLANQDPLTIEVLDASKYPMGLQIPVARSLIGSMRATERFANGEDKQAIEIAMQHGAFNNGVHPLSPLAMLCNASALAGSAKPAGAVPMAIRVVNVAASLRQYEYVGEAMQLAAGCADPKQASMVRAMAETVSTALYRRSYLGSMHCLLAGADAAITAGELGPAQRMLNDAQAIAGRRSVMQPRLNAYGAYVAARLAAAAGGSIGITGPSDVDKAIDLMNGFALNRKNRGRSLISMPRIYQLELIRMALGKQIGGESSDKLLESYCGEPPEVLWRRDPVDAISSVIVDRSTPHIARLQLAASSKNGLGVLAATDALLSHRFHRRLALGGRITQVRSLVRGDGVTLRKEAVDFRNKAPALIKKLRTEVMAAPPKDKGELATRSSRLESLATQIALGRIRLPTTMLPPLQKKTAVAQIPDRTGLLTFVNVGNRLHVTLAAEGKVTFWTVGGVSRVPAGISRLLRSIGVGIPRGSRLPEDSSWRKEAVALRRHLLPDDTTISTERFDSLVIVPDSSLWYLPFEMLPLEDEESQLLGDKIKVRYAATPGLAFRPTGQKSTSRVVGITGEKFFAPRDLELNESILKSLSEAVNESVRLPQEMNVSTSLLSDSVAHLVIAAPNTPNIKNPFATSLANYDRMSPTGTLAAWMRFPARMPESVVMPGYRTAADTAQLASGEEIFLTICALQSAGVRNVLLSRWIVGGESTALAMNELLQELPFEGMQASWNRARAILRRSELNPMAEPMLTKAEHELEGLTGNEPFFWASYLVAAPFSESELKKPAGDDLPTP